MSLSRSTTRLVKDRSHPHAFVGPALEPGECTPPQWMLRIMLERGGQGEGNVGRCQPDSCDGFDLDPDSTARPLHPRDGHGHGDALATGLEGAPKGECAKDDERSSRPHRHEFSSASSNSSSTTGGGFASSSSASSSGFSSSVTSASSTTTFSVSSREIEKDKDSFGGGLGLGLGLGLDRSPPREAVQTPLGLSAPGSPTPVGELDCVRPATLLPRPLAERRSSPTPSTSTLTIHPSPFSISQSTRSVSPSLVPTLKGKEKAERFPSIPSPSPPRSTITLTTTTSDADTEDTDERHLEPDDESILYPPENFAIVVPGIFRSSFPRRKNFAFLKSLGLKSVLTLIQDDYPQENLDYLEREGIQLFQFPIPGNKEPFVHIPDDKIVAAMAVLLDSRNHPLLIHCNKGKHRTGCLVGVLRRLQTWSLTAIFEEYRRYSHPKSRQMDLAFIEAFKGLDLVWEAARENPNLPFWACTTPYETPKRGEVPKEAKTKERSVSRAPSGRSSPVLREMAKAVMGVGGGGDDDATAVVQTEEDTDGGGGGER